MGKKLKLLKGSCTDIGGCANPRKQGDPVSKYKMPRGSKKTSKPVEDYVEKTPPAGAHMNVRDLNAEPGDVRPSLDNANASYTSVQAAQARQSEKDATVNRKRLKINKKKMF